MLGRCTLYLDPVDRGIVLWEGYAQDGITFDSVSFSAVGLLSSRFRTLSIDPIMYMNDFESSGIAAALMCLDLLRVFACARTLQKGRILVPPCREARGYLTLPQFT
ncbi:hypothetical protein M9H77_13969 [Catharanthus roseus]|uniref:Uncharacterized protein n=1 Tax=Catharanthus roseus TaxID=4058 RepID=A0ACC0BLW4_CATRO|nr:hypothetical protein M9H77_13969 [Catharanthus roseus]